MPELETEADLKTELAACREEVRELRSLVWARNWVEGAAAHLAPIAYQVRPMTALQLVEVLDKARGQNLLTEKEWESLLACDLVVRGRARKQKTPIFLVVELAWVVGPAEVERAWTRAGLLCNATGQPCWPVVAGRSITPQAVERARPMGVWRCVRGRPVEGPSI